MARDTREDLEARLAALDAEDSAELWVEDERGRKTKLTGAHAKRWLRNLGLDDEEPEDPDGEDPEPEDPKPADGYWGRKGKGKA